MASVPLSLSLSVSRADRLLREARNCLSFAVGERDETFAAVLIDEALRLAARARELRLGD